MMFEMLYSKIHRATVTDANLNYTGSITIDRDLIDAANLKIGQKVDIVNINNGERISTYVIEGARGSNTICLNGAAARKAQIGDKIIIISYAMIDEKELRDFKPAIILVDEKNSIVKKEESL
ncbi:MAG: aspartate 1-decarboxylase [Campylobacteraceae bacterium]|jgi:aspartate 1-decarboxylase|nr:aspartate 1-decarboxylase [Campylobacteraceae bacterium]